MSRKDYASIAEVLHNERSAYAAANVSDEIHYALDSVTRGLADVFAGENEHFNRKVFYKAAGMS